ncbi:hypothetical protein KAFR_0A03020 [Kazachstania africana CBS 2517]|uniref:Endoplasmic oxidoreductin n=1 Tax=Kazachstania africana (strain ATCC 22294 / BCRC 22015 / CBS 2517 / CECT 1963 / NBRC 1671 / NRRL Y-8276) TaxID=1071382 RepID=H2AMY7_KAZAF|nr:hypothetical protein KAFR_0A03020 [Kazachstania africana CBS 2517]CCF55737.1 hypothetical protein KAFR_0A03020 [Kazachstania africana CBS 2517]
MKLQSLITLLGVTASTVLAQDANGTSPSIQGIADSTPFCKMDKDEKLGPGCDVTIQEINEINKKIRKDVLGLVNTDFFKYFKFDPYKQCTFWENNDGLCFSRSCAIDVVEDWDKLPEYWQPEVLGGVENDQNIVAEDNEANFLNQLCEGTNGINELQKDRDLNYFDINDFTSKDAVLVDLSKNPERFTGYGGQQAGQIWTSIYGENCFSTENEEERCLAKDAFYRIVSGLHASIGTHLSNDHLDTETGEWGPDLDLFMARVGNFPERVSNIYFNYAIVAKALWKINPYMKELNFCSSYNNDVKSKFVNIVSRLESKIFDEDLMFKDDVTSTLKDDFRNRFKNVTKIMDCVHCDRCKLWGKVQTTGYATSLKILFDLDEADEETKQKVVDGLTKYELIALLNTFDRLSKSIESINNFEKMYNDRFDSENNKLESFFNKNNFFKLLQKATESIRNTINSSINGTNNVVVSEEKENDDLIENDATNFNDLKMPKKKKLNNSRNSNEDVWSNAWNAELHNVAEALRFIWRSYLDLPKNLWNLILSNSIKLWNAFVGVSNYIKEDEDANMYKLNI